ncbi:hypothetical protein TI39_contig4461g00001, partial [Zymoseptoria brevis]
MAVQKMDTGAEGGKERRKKIAQVREANERQRKKHRRMRLDSWGRMVVEVIVG